MKLKILLTITATMIIYIITVAASRQPCTGGIYADHPALVAECLHQLSINARVGYNSSSINGHVAGGWCSADDGCSPLPWSGQLVTMTPDPNPPPEPTLPPYP